MEENKLIASKDLETMKQNPNFKNFIALLESLGNK